MAKFTRKKHPLERIKDAEDALEKGVKNIKKRKYLQGIASGEFGMPDPAKKPDLFTTRSHRSPSEVRNRRKKRKT